MFKFAFCLNNQMTNFFIMFLQKLNLFFFMIMILPNNKITMNQIQFTIYGERIICGKCNKSYKLKKNGTPPAYFIQHLLTVHRNTRHECKEFIAKFHKNINEDEDNNEDAKYEDVKDEKNSCGECTICFYEMKNSECCSIPCKHNNFHTECLRKMTKHECPLCRQPFEINLQPQDQPYQYSQQPELPPQEQLSQEQVSQELQQLRELPQLHELRARQIREDRLAIEEQMRQQYELINSQILQFRDGIREVRLETQRQEQLLRRHLPRQTRQPRQNLFRRFMCNIFNFN